MFPMSFSEALPGKEGHSVLVALNEHEIGILEEIKTYVEKRSKINLDYADKITKLHAGMRHECTHSEYGGLFEKAWKAFLTEGENQGIVMVEKTKLLQTGLAEKIQKVAASRKEILHHYNQDRNRLDHTFNCNKDEVKRLGNTYRDVQKEVIKAKDKLQELSSKGKGGKEWIKAKERFDRTSRKLHQNHNDYILAITVANEHQKQYLNELIPFLMETMQKIQQSFISEYKDILMQLFDNTNWCSEEFTTSATEVKQNIIIVNEKEEYHEFLKKNGVTAQPACPFFFEETLISEHLENNELKRKEMVLNDLTHDQLIYRNKTCEAQLDVIAKDLNIKDEALWRIEMDIHAMNNGLDSYSKLPFIEKLTEQYARKRHIKELKSKEAIAKCQLELVTEKLEELGGKSPPAFSFIEPPAGPFLYPEVVTDGPGKSRFSLRDITFPRKKKSDSTQSYVGDEKKSTTIIKEDIATNGVEEKGLNNQAWYHGGIDRFQAMRLLKKDGDFLVRDKADGSSQVLSVMVDGAVKHFIFQPSEDGRFKFDSKLFDTLEDVINFHLQNRIVRQGKTSIFLVNPIKKTFTKGDNFSFVHDDVRLEGKLGRGNFGDVYRGFLIKKNMYVAVKTCRKDTAESTSQFLAEAEIMKPYHHKNVMKLIGVCYEQHPFYLLLELLPHGDLLNFLKKSNSLETKDLHQMATDVSAGMEYLEFKNTIHRDLAARNCLVGENNVVKISDFGMSREEDSEGLYTMNRTNVLPIKWTAPETFNQQIYSTKSDVWSFGVVLYEIFSYGNSPYPGWNNTRTKSEVEKGYRMPPPSEMPQNINTIMQDCWKYDPVERPHFKDIHLLLQKATSW